MALKGFVLDYSDHISSHYKRMASVKGRTDSSTPVSMLKDVRRKNITKRDKNMRRRSGHTLDHNHILYQGCIPTDNTNGVPLGTTQQIQAHTPHTRTGQDNVIIAKRQSKISSTTPQSLVLWNPSTNFKSTTTIASTATQEAKSDDKQSGIKTHYGDSSNCGNSSNPGDSPDVDTQASQDRFIGIRPFQTILALKTSNELLRQSIAKSKMDHDYDQFMLQITKEILESDIESDEQIERILSSHVSRNKQQLREDVMLAKLKVFRQSIGIYRD